MLKPSELIGQPWVKKNGNLLAPNIIKLTSRFNSLAWWVSQVILEPNTPKLRAERISILVDVAMVNIIKNLNITVLIFDE